MHQPIYILRTNFMKSAPMLEDVSIKSQTDGTRLFIPIAE